MAQSASSCAAPGPQSIRTGSTGASLTPFDRRIDHTDLALDRAPSNASVPVTVRRPLAPGTDELGLDRQHSPWADSDVIDVVMLHRDVVHNRPAELPTGEHLPGERLPHSPSVTG